MSSHTVLALDLSATKAGVCWPAGGADRFAAPNSVGTGGERLHWWYVKLRREIDGLTRAPDVVAVEGPSLHSKGQAGMISAAEVRGVARLAARHAIGEDRWVEIPPSSIKKYATGKGNAGKDDVKAACRRRFDWNGESDDEADALWLWALVHHALGSPVVEVPQLNQEALSAVSDVLAKRLGVRA